IQGWINYYSKFSKSSFVPILKYINDRLRIWAQRKFSKLRKKKGRAIDLIKRVIKLNPRLFAHWKWIPMY
ncbi:MAG: hypothetical protein GY861_03615, partial [bacterium]|nr:hypothetical protein [bacterium]